MNAPGGDACIRVVQRLCHFSNTAPLPPQTLLHVKADAGVVTAVVGDDARSSGQAAAAFLTTIVTLHCCLQKFRIVAGQSVVW